MIFDQISRIQFENAWLILLIIPLTVFLVWLIRKEFITQHSRLLSKKQKIYGRLLLIMSRILIASLLIIALSRPFITNQDVVEDDPKIALLIDQSLSMYPYNTNFTDDLVNRISERIPVIVQTFNDSDLPGILLESAHYGNIIAVTDMNTLSSEEKLEQSLEYLAVNNATFGIINITPEKNEASVRIIAPTNAIEGSSPDINILVEKTFEDPVELILAVDGKQIMKKEVGEGENYYLMNYPHIFSKGFHNLTAVINPEKDHYSRNNIYFHTLQVVKKPVISIIKNNPSERSYFDKVLQNVYEINYFSKPPVSASDEFNYLSDNNFLLFEDYSISSMSDEDQLKLKDDVFNGMNLLFLGGKNSFDFDEYKGSVIESLLPVKIAQANRIPVTDINIAVLIDISGSTGQGMAGQSAVNVEKAIAIDLISQTRDDSKIGVIAFNNNPMVLQKLSLLNENQRSQLYEDIAALENGGGTSLDKAFEAGFDMVNGAKGSRNIIIISDGFALRKSMIEKAVKEARELGITTHSVIIGDNVNYYFLRKLAILGSGKIFRPEDARSVKLIFKTDEKEDDSERISLMTIMGEHFIAQKEENINISITGYNQIVSKDNAQTIIGTVYNQPIITTWRYGLGKVLVIGTGDEWAKELITSSLVPRSINWAIGEGIQSNLTVSYGEDKVTIISKLPLDDFAKIDNNKYVKSLDTYLLSPGIHNFNGAQFYVNYDEELGYVLPNLDNSDIFESYGGYFTDKDSVDEIVYRAKSSSRKTIMEKQYLTEYLLYFLAFIYLLEVVIRRIFKYKKLNS